MRTISAGTSCSSTVAGITVPTETAKLTFVTGLTCTLENERVIWVRCSELRFVGTLPVVAPECVPDAPTWLEPDSPAAPAWLEPDWQLVAPDVPVDPDCVLCCEPEPEPDPAGEE